MKIAITGHTSNIGEAFSKKLKSLGHEIIGISRRTGENIRRIERCKKLIEPCDLFINNAQEDFCQTNLFFEVWKMWEGQKKYIWNISTMMTELPVSVLEPELEKVKYQTEKKSLEELGRQLRYKQNWPQITLIKPGQITNEKATHWVNSLLQILSVDHKLRISEISIGYTDNNLKL